MSLSVGPEDVLRFWFGDVGPDDPVAAEVAKRWWVKDAAFDQEIRDRFAEALDAAPRGDLDAWTETPRGTVALIILLDQFTRNTRRGSPEMYANDAQARELTRLLLDSGREGELHPAHRMFATMPLMHSEDPVDQERCVVCLERSLEAAVAAGHPYAHTLERSVESAKHHRDIVVQWGRFPHRNAILSRESTPEETEFLTRPGSSF